MPVFLGLTPKAETPPARTIHSEHQDNNGIKRIFLTQMTRAKRAGTWFGLSRVQRSLYSLAMRLPLKLQSPELLRALVSVLKCLRETLDGAGAAFLRAVRLAWMFSAAAVGWGNPAAKAWRSDISYARYLGTHMTSEELRSCVQVWGRP